MPGHRYAFIPATPLALALYDGPLLPDGQPLPPDRWPARAGFAAWIQEVVAGRLRLSGAERELLSYPRENVPSLLHALRAGRFCIVYYALPGATAADHTAARALVARGEIDDYLDAPTVGARVAAAARLPLNGRNSHLILTDAAEFGQWQPLGFDYDGRGGNVCLLGKYDGPELPYFDYLTVNDKDRLVWCKPDLAPNIRRARTTLGLTPDTVLYLEPADAPAATRAFMANQHPRIEAALAAKGLRYLRWVSAGEGAVGAAVTGELLDALRYAYPALKAISETAARTALSTLTQALTAADFARALLNALDLPEPGAPLLLRHVEGIAVPPNGFTARVLAPPPDTADSTSALADQLDEYLANVGRHPDDSVMFQTRFPSEEEMAAADYRFPDEGQRLPPELVAQIAALKAAAPEGALFELLLHIADQLTDTHPAVKQTLLPLLRPAAAPTAAAATAPTALNFSPLVIDGHFRLWLPAFGNVEIKLTPLPKTLLLFFLRRPPAGLMLHDLTDHQPALLALYQQLQPDVDTATARARIAGLVDVRGNSINEKCSRIKEAFVREMADEVARHYYITGERAGPKGVRLPRGLVQWLGYAGL